MVAASVFAACAVLSASCGEGAEPVRRGLASNPPAVTSAASGFSVLRLPRRSGDALPRGAGVLVARASSAFGAGRPPRVRRVPGGWLLSFAGARICLMHELRPIASPRGAGRPPLPELACATLAMALEGELLVTMHGGLALHGASRVVGVVPDGVTSVKIESAGGAPVIVRVNRNGYVAVVTAPRAVSFLILGRHGETRPVALGLAPPPVVPRR